jgi:arginase
VLIHAVPQWQGSATTRASMLQAGCGALARLAGDVLDVPVRDIEVPSEGAQSSGGIRNREVLLQNIPTQRAALSEVDDSVLTIGGDCGVELAPLEAARLRHVPDLTALWFDAHADLNTPVTSPSGAFHGMVLRVALGDGDDVLAADRPLSKWRVLLAGTRNLDAAERELLPRLCAMTKNYVETSISMEGRHARCQQRAWAGRGSRSPGAFRRHQPVRACVPQRRR